LLARTVTVSPGRFAIVLELDDLAAVAVRQITQELTLERTPAPANVPPHVTLAACRNLDVDALRTLLADLAAHTHVIATTLGAIGVFPGAPSVVFLAPTIGRELVEIQLKVLERLQDLQAEVERYWLAGQWVPHCTLATGIPRELVSLAVDRVYAPLRPISASLTTLSLFAIESPRQLYAFALQPVA
jgi:2'-5' RNA ligase